MTWMRTNRWQTCVLIAVAAAIAAVFALANGEPVAGVLLLVLAGVNGYQGYTVRRNLERQGEHDRID
jgi:hypothetical protein